MKRSGATPGAPAFVDRSTVIEAAIKALGSALTLPRLAAETAVTARLSALHDEDVSGSEPHVPVARRERIQLRERGRYGHGSRSAPTAPPCMPEVVARPRER